MTQQTHTEGNGAGARAGKSGGGWLGMLREAAAFWEPARIAYNIVLILTALLWLIGLRGLVNAPLPEWLLLALAANAIYCGAYAMDLFLQHTRQSKGWRPTLWFAGTFVVWTLLNMGFWLIHVFGGLMQKYR
jgi:hypothetical protein